MRELKQFMLTLLCVSFVSCASNPKTVFQTGDFCGLIVDENNRPIKEFILEVNNQFKGGTYVTNNNGIFVVPSMETGKIFIKGKKKGYTILNEEVNFLADQNLFCWQIKSMSGVLDDILVYVRTEQYRKALEHLQTVAACDDENVKSEINKLEKKLRKKIKEERKNEKQ